VFPDSSDESNPAQKKCRLCHSGRRLKKSKLTDASKPFDCIVFIGDSEFVSARADSLE
jgi:hypothetical protein